MELNIAKRIVAATAAFFDTRLLARVDLLTQCDGEQSVYVDALGVSTIPEPTSAGHNLYKFIPEDKNFVQELHFQSGSPANGVNGISNEAALSAILHRLSKQNETFPSPYNQLAIICIQTAIAGLQLRIKDRKEFGIYDTEQVEPNADEEMEVSKAISILNSLGLIGDLIIKFDRSYGLTVPGAIHKQVERLVNYVNPGDEVNILTATTMMSTAIQMSGISGFWRGVALTVHKAYKESTNDQTPAENNPTNDSA